MVFECVCLKLFKSEGIPLHDLQEDKDDDSADENEKEMELKPQGKFQYHVWIASRMRVTCNKVIGKQLAVCILHSQSSLRVSLITLVNVSAIFQQMVHM